MGRVPLAEAGRIHPRHQPGIQDPFSVGNVQSDVTVGQSQPNDGARWRLPWSRRPKPSTPEPLQRGGAAFVLDAPRDSPLVTKSSPIPTRYGQREVVCWNFSSAYQLTSVGVLQEKHWTGLSSKLQNLQMFSSIVPMLHGLRGTRHRC